MNQTYLSTRTIIRWTLKGLEAVNERIEKLRVRLFFCQDLSALDLIAALEEIESLQTVKDELELWQIPTGK